MSVESGLVRLVTTIAVSALVAAAAFFALDLASASVGNTFEQPIKAVVTLVFKSPEVSADLNNDGNVDTRDLMIVARNISSGSPGDDRADVDRNGAVDVSDLAFVARYV